MSGADFRVKESMTFVPSGKEYGKEIEFYEDLGFHADWKSEDLALLRIGSFRFFLQKFENQEMQNNFMMNLEVENLDDWWSRIEGLNLADRYKGVRMKAPQDYPWGKREIHLISPAGVLWHIAVPSQKEARE